MENFYSSGELMKIFNIKPGSWGKIKKIYNLDNYSIKKGRNYKYTQKAYEVLESNYKINAFTTSPEVEEIKENNQSLILLMQQNNILSKQLEDTKEMFNTFKEFYIEEKEKNVELEKLKEVLNLKNNNLEQEIEKIKNRSLIERILNKDLK